VTDFHLATGRHREQQDALEMRQAILAIAMAALAVCAATAALAPRTSTWHARRLHPVNCYPGDPGLIALTIAEIKRVFNLVTRAWQPIRHYLHWSDP
jgi:hypothetical protein